MRSVTYSMGVSRMWMRGRPGPRRGTRMASRAAVKCGLSPRFPAVTSRNSGRWPCSQARWIFVVQPLRDRPKPWSSGSVRLPPGGCLWDCPSRRAPAACWWARQIVESTLISRVISPAAVRPGLQPGPRHVPCPVPLPAAEAPADRLPWSVLGGQIPPRGTSPHSPADPVDQPPPAHRRPAQHRDRQQWSQHGPLVI